MHFVYYSLFLPQDVFRWGGGGGPSPRPDRCLALVGSDEGIFVELADAQTAAACYTEVHQLLTDQRLQVPTDPLPCHAPRRSSV